MRDKVLVVCLTIQLDFLDIVSISFFLDDEFVLTPILRVELYRHFIESRSGKRIFGHTRTIGVKSHHAEDGPCGHRTGVVVARNTVGLGGEMLGEQFLHQLLCAPFLTLETAEEIRISDVGFVRRVIVALVEHTLKLVHELLVPTHQFGQAFDVMRNKERVVPSVTFVETGARSKVRAFLRVERFVELAFLRNRTERTELLAEVVLVTHRTVIEQLGILLLAQRLRKGGKRMVCHIVFEGMGNGVVILAFHRHIALCHIVIVVGTHQVILARSGG